MTLTFFTNLVHHHQIPVADEFYRLLGMDYRYVAIAPLTEMLIKGGYDPNIERPYLIRAYESEEATELAKKLMIDSDVVIAAYGFEELLRKRKAMNKITFHYNERWLKTDIVRSFMPGNLWMVYRNFFRYRNKRCYMLCASAFTAKDVKKYFCFPHKCFKWGYFTKVEKADVDLSSDVSKKDEKTVRMLWCARFLSWKHPEMAVELARRLKDDGFDFVIDMYGSGEKFEDTKALANALDVKDVVRFKGNVANEEMRKVMAKHEIFLFTSDRNEGWGAVANESMSQGCILVGSDKIGSVPFLVKDNINGLIFRSGNMESLTEKVEWLLEHPKERTILSNNAITTMQEVWSPKNAAESFLELVNYIQEGRLKDYHKMKGPASWAE